MELADVLDSKSCGGDTVRVRPPLPAFRSVLHATPSPLTGGGFSFVWLGADAVRGHNLKADHRSSTFFNVRFTFHYSFPAVLLAEKVPAEQKA